jgi:hypothetical protein
MTAPTVASSGRPASAAHRWMPFAWFLAAAVLFFFANRAAYQGYFSDDDLDKLGWPTLAGADTFYRELLTPKLSDSNFRPVGYLYYRFMGRAFKLHYSPYVAVLQAGHLMNVILLFFVLRRLGFPQLAVGAGCLFYAFHAAVIEAYWEPQYIFEVLACMLCLAAMLLYLQGRWILALIPFWFAYKSKEIAVMLPVALLAAEMLLGERKWKRLLPYFLISLNFGLQALWTNRHVSSGNTYALRFTPSILEHTIAFYSSAIVFLPFAGLALLPLPLVLRDRRLYVGIIFVVSLFAPMLALPGRLDSVYWYIPMVGVAIAVATIASRAPRWAIALFFLLWFPLNYVKLREKRRELLALGDENRWFTTGLMDYARRVPPLKAVVYQSTPPHMGQWGVEGAIHDVFGFAVDAVWNLSPRAHLAMAEVPMAIVSYYPVPHVVKGMLRTRNELQSYVRFSDEIPKSQFGSGWNGDGDLRSLASRAEVTLYRPREANQFEIVASPGPAKINVTEDGQPLGSQTLRATHPEPLRWNLSGSSSGNKTITIMSEPAGISVVAVGYVTP